MGSSARSFRNGGGGGVAAEEMLTGAADVIPSEYPEYLSYTGKTLRYLSGNLDAGKVYCVVSGAYAEADQRNGQLGPCFLALKDGSPADHGVLVEGYIRILSSKFTASGTVRVGDPVYAGLRGAMTNRAGGAGTFNRLLGHVFKLDSGGDLIVRFNPDKVDVRA